MDALGQSPPASADLADFRLRREVQRLHELGSRPVYELLVELGQRFGCRTLIEQRLARFNAIPPEALDITGGRDLPPTPLHEVKR